MDYRYRGNPGDPGSGCKGCHEHRDVLPGSSRGSPRSMRMPLSAIRTTGMEPPPVFTGPDFRIAKLFDRMKRYYELPVADYEQREKQR